MSLGNRKVGNKVAAVGRILIWPLQVLQEARGTLFPWIAVFIGIGISVWFAMPEEPGLPSYGLALALLAFGVIGRFRGAEVLHPLFIITASLAMGWLASGVRVHLQAAPMLEFRYYGPVEGRIVGIDRSQSDALRLTLDRVVLRDMAPEETPLRVRVSIQGEQSWLKPFPGQTVILTASLAAPDGPVEPGGFDFRRMAFFDRLGAVGYTRNPVLLLEPAAAGDALIDRLRSHMADGMRAQMPGDAGAFAAGAMTGDRSGITQETVQALRDSSLAHLLAISGMNMAFLVTFVFGLIRYGVALIPPLALRVNAKKLAAVVSFGVAFFYLLLSGANVATERAFIMVSVMLGAILLDRRALTMRSVALSAVILLLIRPESLMEPGFQMSFAATVALIAGFAALDAAVFRERMPRWMVPVFMLVLSSVIAGVATAPYAAAHFNRFTDYGLLANLLTVPVMGAVVMPAGAVAALLAPFGLEALPLWVMELGSRWILFVAHWVAGLDGSVTAIPTPGPFVLPLITLGGIWVILWRGRVQALGPAMIAVALVMWSMATRPELLITADGKLLGLLGPEGRALSANAGGGFAAQTWLENDGDLSEQKLASARPGFKGRKGEKWFRIGDLDAVSLTGKGAQEKLADICASGALVILADIAEAPPEGCRLIDQSTLRNTGALAVWLVEDGLEVVTTRNATRLWSGRKTGTLNLSDIFSQRKSVSIADAR
jgi:competence protein ComEC